MKAFTFLNFTLALTFCALSGSYSFSQTDTTSTEDPVEGNYMMLSSNKKIELPGMFFNAEFVGYEDASGEMKTMNRRDVIYVKHSPAVYMSLPLVGNGYSKLTQVWAYSEKYILTIVPSEIKPDVAYLNVYDMDFKLSETRLKIEAEGNSKKKNEKIRESNNVVIETLKKYFSSEELFTALNDDLSEMIRLSPAYVQPYKDCEGCSLPFEKLMKADLKR